MSTDVVEKPGAAGIQNPAGHRLFPDVCAHLKSVVLLGGSVRPSDLSRSIDRSLLDLPVEPGRSVLALWQEHVEALAAASGIASLPVRVLIDRSGLEPTLPAQGPRAPISVERDAAEFRGTGGILRDLAADYGPGDLLLVANAAQILIEPLSSLAADLMSPNASVSLIGHRDGTPGGLFLVRCSALTTAGNVGFLDFKEQFLPRLAGAGHDVRVVAREHASGLPVRTLDGYLAGLRAYYRLRAGRTTAAGAFAEDWSPTFSLVEPGARVASGATVHDSVVLSGGSVEEGAVVVRSVVSPGGLVQRGQTIAGRIVASRDRAARRPA